MSSSVAYLKGDSRKQLWGLRERCGKQSRVCVNKQVTKVGKYNLGAGDSGR